MVCLPALPQAALYRITGTLVNSATGEPVRQATVTALSSSDHQTVASFETGNDGRFALEGLAAAKYDLVAVRRGFLLSLYNQHELFNTAIVTGEGQQTEGLIFRMTPVASLHGIVTSDVGDPVENAKVLLFLKSHNPGDRITQKAETLTDDTGEYDFGDLAPGEYFLAVSAKPWYALHHSVLLQRPAADPSTALDVAYPVTYYDSTMDEASATPINLAAGSREEANINLHALPALHLTSESTNKQDGIPARSELRQIIFGSLASTDSITPQPTAQNGPSEFSGVAPGHYELSLGDPPRIADLNATANQQLDANLGKPAIDLSGTLRITSGAALPDKVTLSIETLDGVRSQVPHTVQSSDGQFSFQSIRQGNYELTASSPDKQLPITSITIDGHTHPGNQLTVSDKPLQVVVNVSLSETRIEGFAKKAEKGVPGVMVVLIPKEPSAFPALARRDQSDSDGSFALRDVAPGNYTIVAIEDGWELDWERPDLIARYLPGGIPVSVTESSGKLLRLSEALPVQAR
ncbi:MAG: collagen binding domain-containing protein [Terracidiphilus sp.]